MDYREVRVAITGIIQQNDDDVRFGADIRGV
jgi:hypothetical protein